MDDWGWMGIAAAVMGLGAAIITVSAIILRRFGKGKKPPPPEEPSE